MTLKFKFIILIPPPLTNTKIKLIPNVNLAYIKYILDTNSTHQEVKIARSDDIILYTTQIKYQVLQ